MSTIKKLDVPIRVRYSETDAMGFLHHGNYPTYLEEARTELFRANGGDYRAMEERGLFFVVVDLSIKFRKPARYDDVLTVTVSLERTTFTKLVHAYRITRDGVLLTEATTVLAMLNRAGQIQKLGDQIAGMDT